MQIRCVVSGFDAELKIVSFISAAPFIEKILKQLQLRPTEHLSKLPPEAIYDEMIDYQSFDDGWGGYREPRIKLH